MVLSAPVTARSRGSATGSTGAGISGAGSEGGGRVASRSSRSCLRTSLVTMATNEAAEAVSVGGRSSERPAAAEAIRRRQIRLNRVKHGCASSRWRPHSRCCSFCGTSTRHAAKIKPRGRNDFKNLQRQH